MSREGTGDIRFWPFMFAIFIGSFVAVMSSSTITIALPEMQRYFGVDLSVIQWTLTGFMLAMGTVAPLTGYLGDRFSAKRLYLGTLLGFAVASLVCGWAWDAYSLIAFRVLQGAFCGAILPVTMTLIYQVLPREKQAMAVSLWSLSAMLAPAFGPTLAGWLITAGNWRWLFFINLPVCLLALAMAARSVPYYRLRTAGSFDAPGLVTVITGSLLLLMTFSKSGAWGWSSPRTLGLFAVGSISLAFFVVRELRTHAPLLDLRVLANGRYLLTLIVSIIITISLYSGTFLMPVFLQHTQGRTALDTGLILLPASLVMALLMPLVGRLYPVLGPRVLMTTGVLLMGGGTYALSDLTPDTSRTYVLVWMVVRNAGISLSTMPSGNAGMEQIPPALSGHASSISNWLRNVFGSFSIAIFTSLLATFGRHEAESLRQQGMTNPAMIERWAFVESINDVYLVATVIVLAALPLCLLVSKNPGLASRPSPS
ncbi:DHA2 family efflux MFS transporter permease subunit [Melittangium boletus]|uniref:DHA2 family efflux MFS transporter permease subunit n=1 Tax=Melittangium boletus TaxID=83453 RepID=UPI001FE75E70|nr:DHA2 family efflux MFS transporter permease subunit [Melittangium boletus]